MFRHENTGFFLELLGAVGGPTFAAVYDLDGSGHLDIARVQAGIAKLTGLSHSGNYSFSSLGDTPRDAPQGVIAAIATNIEGGPGGEVAFLSTTAGLVIYRDPLNVGTGTEGYSTSGAPQAFALGDVDGDGDVDAVVLVDPPSATEHVLVYENDGFGGFAKTAGFVLPGPRALALADVNGDSKADLFVGTSNGTVDIHRGIGSGQFAFQSRLGFGEVPIAIEIANLDADAGLEMAVIVENDPRVYVAGLDGT
jgi:hypothetical protein